jgi:hypothetical protein
MMFNNQNVLKIALSARWAGMLIEAIGIPIWYNAHHALVFKCENELVLYLRHSSVRDYLIVPLHDVVDVLRPIIRDIH